jgi:hypothetical protein
MRLLVIKKGKIVRKFDDMVSNESRPESSASLGFSAAYMLLKEWMTSGLRLVQ